MVERQDPDNFPCLQMRERCALEIAAYVFNTLIVFLKEFFEKKLVLKKRQQTTTKTREKKHSMQRFKVFFSPESFGFIPGQQKIGCLIYIFQICGGIYTFNSFFARFHFCRLLITFANSLDPNQDPQSGTSVLIWIQSL